MRARIDDFLGSTEEYIDYLETALLDLRTKLTITASTVHGDERQLNLCQASHNLEYLESLAREETRAGPQKRPRQLEIVQYTPDNVNSKSPTDTPWKKLARILVRETPCANNWAGTLRDNGLHDMMSTGKAVAILLGPGHESNARTNQVRTPAIEDEQGAFGRVTEYARAAVQNCLDASAALMLANFQKFLVFCLCNVMRDTGSPLGDVYGIVRICLGNVSDDYCCRVLRAAVYLNKLVDTLYMDGWGLRASELLLLCEHLIRSLGITKS